MQWQSPTAPNIGKGSSLHGQAQRQMRSSTAAAVDDAKSQAALHRIVRQTGFVDYDINSYGQVCKTKPCLVQVPGGQASADSRHQTNSDLEAECAVPSLPQGMSQAQVQQKGAVSLY